MITGSRKHYFLIVLLGAVLFIPFLGKVHLFDWDEINFAESAREMIVTGNYSRVTIDFKPFWEKPPLFFWLQAASMKIFGINEFAARFPNAICGMLTLCLIFFLGRKYFDETFGWLWVLAYIGSFLPHFYFKSGIIDPWFNLFIFSGVVLLAQASGKNTSCKQFALSGVFVGLAVLTKGPVGFLIVFLTGSILYLSISKRIHIKSALIFLVSMIAVSSLWFGMEVVKNGIGFISEFVQYQALLLTTEGAGHGGPFYYHAVVLFLGCFPASMIALNSFFRKPNADAHQILLRKWMVVLFLVVLLLFSIVRTKIIHYSSLCYFPLTFLAAWEIYFRIKSGIKISKVTVYVLLASGILIGIAATLLPYLGNHVDLIIPYVKDSFAKANLAASVDWPLYLMTIGILYTILTAASFISITKDLKKGTILLFAGTCIFIQALMFSFVPRIERYTQGAAIDFYKGLQDKDVYVQPLEFKSYAHLFYTEKMPQLNPNNYDTDWLLNGEIDKPAYLVCKITKAPQYTEMPQLEEIGSKNGFVFFKREPPHDFR